MVTTRWMNLREACRYCGCTRPTLRNWIDEGLKVAKIGTKTYRVKKEDVDAFMEAHYFEGSKTIANNILEEMSR